MYYENKKLIVEPGQITRNKTLEYLCPCLKDWGDEFDQFILSNSTILGAGISDTNIEVDIQKDRIYILVDMLGQYKYGKYLNPSVARLNFFETLEWFTSHPSYITDYIYNNNYHMLVFKIPDKHLNNDIVDKFLQGKYSKMYNEDSYSLITKTIKIGGEYVYTKPYKVITRVKSYRKDFAEKIKEDFGVRLDIDTTYIEWDYPPTLRAEVFNYKHKTETAF